MVLQHVSVNTTMTHNEIIDEIVVIEAPVVEGYWVVPENLDTTAFDFNWRPDPYDPPYIHQFGTQWQKTGGPKFVVKDSTEVKYHDSQRAIKLPEPSKFQKLVHHEIEFDYSWHPDDTEPEFIYVIGCQYYTPQEFPVLEYKVKNATDKKFLSDVKSVLVTNKNNYVRLHEINDNTFDWSWHPHPWDPPFIYVWGNNQLTAEEMPTLEYHVPGATQRKYMNDQRPKLANNKSYWKVHEKIVESNFDFDWAPPVYDPPFIYVWGNKWVPGTISPTVEYIVPGATDKKFVSDNVLLEQTKENWEILIPIDESKFDFSWRPDPTSPPYIYVFGNKWNEAGTEATVRYVVKDATEIKYVEDIVAHTLPNMNMWSNTELKSFDYSWRPNPFSPPQIYQWENNGPTYTVPGATEIVLMKNENLVQVVNRYYVETTLESLIEEHPDEIFWALNKDLTYDNFDFNWRPDETNFKHLNIFGNSLSKDTKTYFVNAMAYRKGFKEINYIEMDSFTIQSKLDMFYIDMGNGNNQYEILKQKYPWIQKTRYVNTWVDTISRCAKKANSKLIWVLCSYLDYSEFKFDFYPSTWQSDMVHVFGTQWNHWGNTYLINTEQFLEQTKFIKVLEHLPNINHIRTKKAPNTVNRYNFIYVDHSNTDGQQVLEFIKSTGKNVNIVPFKDSYLKTLREYINANKNLSMDNYYWVVSSICDYSQFDFTYLPDPFQHEQLHVFASSYDGVKQKYGDTFLLNTKSFADECDSLTRLEDYSKQVNYISHISVKRSSHPIKIHKQDSQVDAIDLIEKTYPYTELININDCYSSTKRIVPSVWDFTHNKIIVGTKGASQILVPKMAKPYIINEVYDYPYIDNSDNIQNSKPLDIIFISNGEPIADKNYEHLLEVTSKLGVKNSVKRIKDVNGRVASQHAAANISSTSWYFLVNGKVRVSETFDWSWQPDRLQKQKHYIFTVTNPVNGLEYGHQAIVANNKHLTLTTQMQGLDFTLDSLHEVVNMNCGVALYNTDAWTAWRTAFRESIKLSCNKDEVSKDRLARWISDGVGDYAEYSKQGALDGIAYYDSVNGELDKLLLTYDWVWIRNYYDTKYGQQ